MTMKLRLSFTIILALVASAAAAGAQPPAPNPMMAHYRAYVAADARGDYETAHEEAVAALAAAEVAQSPRIGILATNLARLRAFRFHDLERAHAPALRAAEAGNVDAGQAELLVALTALSTTEATRVEDNLSEIVSQKLSAQGQRPDADYNYLYEIAQTWGYWALGERRRDAAITAYSRAASYAARLGAAGAVDRGAALTALGAAQLYSGRYREAGEALQEALVLLAPLAPESRGRAVPHAERTYFGAVAWMSLLRAKLMSDRRDAIPDFPEVARASLPGEPPPCSVEYVKEPAVEYPRPMLDELAVGAVVLRYGVDEDGRMRDHQILATAPVAPDFAEAVLKATRKWRVTFPESDAPCRRASDDRYIVFPFRFK